MFLAPIGTVDGAAAIEPLDPCVGDCDGIGAVTIDKIILLVNIALGTALPADCPNGIPPQSAVDVSVIIEAVVNALASCPIPNVAGTWREELLRVASSNCNAATANVLAQIAATQPAICDTQLTQDGTQVHGVDCEGGSGDATIDAAGTVVFVPVLAAQTFENGCTLTVNQNITLDASHSPTTAFYTLDLMFSGPCAPAASCTAHLESRWTRL